MVSLGKIDFTGHKDMYESLKVETEGNIQKKNFMIFDEDGHTVWLIWYEMSLI